MRDQMMPWVAPAEHAWRERAVCRGFANSTLTGLVFHPVSTDESTRRAMAMCARCPVTKECIEEGLSMPTAQDQGIRGGLTEEERLEVRRARRRGRMAS